MLSTYADNATFTARAIYMDVAIACAADVSYLSSAYVCERDVYITAAGVRDYAHICAVCEGVCGFELTHEGCAVSVYTVAGLGVRVVVYRG